MKQLIWREQECDYGMRAGSGGNAHQLDVMQPTCSIAAVAVGMTAPKLRPVIVRENAPVTTAFAATAVGTGASYEKARYCVAATAATVKMKLKA